MCLYLATATVQAGNGGQGNGSPVLRQCQKYPSKNENSNKLFSFNPMEENSHGLYEACNIESGHNYKTYDFGLNIIHFVIQCILEKKAFGHPLITQQLGRGGIIMQNAYSCVQGELFFSNEISVCYHKISFFLLQIIFANQIQPKHLIFLK